MGILRLGKPHLLRKLILWRYVVGRRHVIIHVNKTTRRFVSTMISSFLALFVLSFFVLTTVDGANNPNPNPDSVVTAGEARFTVLTSRLIRMEWGQTVDSATLTFLNRYLPAPSFKQHDDGQWKIIETDYLTVRLFTCI